MTRQFKISDVVSIHPASRYFEQGGCQEFKSNPCFMRGVVTFANKDLEDNPWIDVTWDNGEENSYYTHDLLLNPRMPAFSKPKGMGEGTTAKQITDSMFIQYLYTCPDITSLLSSHDCLNHMSNFDRLQRGPQFTALHCATVGRRPNGTCGDA